ncbi:cytochrome c biogenesis CcdA family protein [Trichloromonas sp.]|uniref:cytochrome c biogenesis CcdA family protein n=1 Tax=Trichloromonas sp. TaxID=3069249 RepID=UPI003D819991
MSAAISGTPLLALAAALAWGVVSVVLSPCHLASIPLIVGFIDGQGRMSTRRAFVISILFAVGILITIALIGVATAIAGRMLGDVGVWGNWLVAAVFLLVGLHLLDIIPLPWAAPGRVGIARKGMLAAFLLGLIFGIALGPCSFAYMAPVLGVAFGEATGNMLYAAMLLLAYGIGHCSVIVLAGTFTELIQRYLDWNEKSKGAIMLRRICGLLVIVAGIWLVYSAP